MSDDDWADFTALVIGVIADIASPEMSFTYDGSGEWDGIREESRCIVSIGTTYPGSLRRLREQLSRVAVWYGQDAIGLAVGAGELVSARTDSAAATS
jgi:hypothetical protein